MNGGPQDVWFYTKQGERCGPVSFAELRVRATESPLHPRIDMVWTAGMTDWKPSGEIEGLFEKRVAPVKQEPLAPPADPYTPPKGKSVEEQMRHEEDWPGARRRSYLFAVLVFPTLMNTAIAMGAPLLVEQFGTEITGWIMVAAGVAPAFVAFYFGLQRFSNLGMSRWWIFGNLVPVLNLWVGYRSFVCPAGYAYHRKLDGTGVFLAIVYWILILLLTVAIIAVAATLAGAVDNPELRKAIGDVIRVLQTPLKKP